MIAVATLGFSTPSIMKFSFVINLPEVSYNTRDFVSVAASFKNPVAPLFLPLMKVGTDNVMVSFNVNSVVV